MGQSTSTPQQQHQMQLPSSHPPVAGSSPSSPPAGCPMHQKAAAEPTPPPQCPMHASSSAPALNPLNNIPADLTSAQAPNQSTELPTERVTSSIPRTSDVGGKWEYPSPQQFYNALVRKGWETPEEHVETMVEIHNFLNEEAWNEVMKWERRTTENPQEEPELARLQGKPGQLSPKARFHLFAAKLFPSRFSSEPPFDRHDWVIRRPATGEEVRYVIDYYSAPDDAEGNPVFSLDVRPALDSFGSIRQRISAATEDAWKSLRDQQNN